MKLKQTIKKEEYYGLTNALKVADKIMDILDEHGKSPMAVRDLVVMINDLLLEQKKETERETVALVLSKLEEALEPKTTPKLITAIVEDVKELIYEY